MFISNAKNHKTRICTHWLRGACLRGRACTFAHGDHELQASASSSGPGAAPVQVSRLCREEICAVRQYAAPLPRPLQFEPHGSIFTLPATASASPNNDFVRDIERQLDAVRLRAEEERLEAEARAERARRFEEVRLATLREEVRAAQAERAALQAAQAEEERAGRWRAAEAAARGARAADSTSSFFTQHSYQGQRGAAPSSGFSTGLRHSSSGSANGRELMQGPRGGLYYINSNGNKTYVRK